MRVFALMYLTLLDCFIAVTQNALIRYIFLLAEKPVTIRFFPSGIVNTIKIGFNNAVGFIKSLASSAFRWGADIIEGIVNGIKPCIGKVKDAVCSVADTIKSFLHFSVPDEGPLTEYESWMSDFMAGLAKGIENSKGNIIHIAWR